MAKKCIKRGKKKIDFSSMSYRDRWARQWNYKDYADYLNKGVEKRRKRLPYRAFSAHITEQFRIIRESLGIMQKDVAEKLGVDPALLTHYKKARALPTPERISAVLEAVDSPYRTLEKVVENYKG